MEDTPFSARNGPVLSEKHWGDRESVEDPPPLLPSRSAGSGKGEGRRGGKGVGWGGGMIGEMGGRGGGGGANKKRKTNLEAHQVLIKDFFAGHTRLLSPLIYLPNRPCPSSTS